jgi:hypothetical protein
MGKFDEKYFETEKSLKFDKSLVNSIEKQIPSMCQINSVASRKRPENKPIIISAQSLAQKFNFRYPK